MLTKRAITVVGCHAEGEVGDVITGGVLPPAGATMLDKKLTMEREHDHIRRLLIQEPRGSVARHVNLLVPATRSDAQAGAIIMEPTEYPPMSGSNTMCITTVLLETGIVPMQEPETRMRLDMPGGPVDVVAECRNGKCVSVTIANVPAFAAKIDAPLEVEGVGTIKIDISYGGMFYAIVDARALGFSVEPHEARDLAVLGEKIRMAAREQHHVVHPDFPDIHDVSIVQFAMPFPGPDQVVRNTCIVSPGRSDRSPTGTGTSARMAALHARGLLKVGQGITHESIIGSRFEGKIIGKTTLTDGTEAVQTTIKGRAWITGVHQYFVDPSDPWPEGYVVADTWGTSGTTTQS
jgi:proline racemase